MKKHVLITVIVMFVLFSGIAAFAVIKGHNSKIPDNDPETLGNLAGNLNNMGYFCEHDGQIYFANSYDNYSLYSLDPHTMEAKLIVDVPAQYINAAGDYLYFYYNDEGDTKFMGVQGNNHGVYRIKTDGKEALNCLDRTVSGIVSLSGNRVFYQHYDNTDGMTLYSVTTNGKDRHQMSGDIINPSCIIDENIYYPDVNNNYCLNIFRTDSESSAPYSSIRVYNPVSDGGYIYFMNVDDDYCLYRYGLSDNSLTRITKERVDCFNIYGNSVFYQTNSESRPRLVRVNSDGSSPEIISEGNYTDINCTSSYTFFRSFDDEVTFYMIPTAGGTSVSSFNPIY